jgi:two-component system, chemotaxis family, CheB/CheR fusion protein
VSTALPRRIRDDCVFARQDITRDPPFSNLHLILCRNVLIYLGPELQQKVLGIFHYALQPNGVLVLGQAESIATCSDLFAQPEKRQRIFVRRPVPSPRGDMSTVRGLRYGGTSQTAQRAAPANHFGPAEKLLLEAYSPAAVVVNEQQRIVHTRGRTGCYLELAAGNPDLHVLRMARPGLLPGLRAALLEARRKGDVVRREGERVDLDGSKQRVNLAVWPLAHRRHTATT